MRGGACVHSTSPYRLRVGLQTYSSMAICVESDRRRSTRISPVPQVRWHAQNGVRDVAHAHFWIQGCVWRCRKVRCVRSPPEPLPPPTSPLSGGSARGLRCARRSVAQPPTSTRFSDRMRPSGGPTRAMRRLGTLDPAGECSPLSVSGTLNHAEESPIRSRPHRVNLAAPCRCRS